VKPIAPGRTLSVLYSDEALIVVSKPSGMPSVHDAMQPEQDVQSLLKEQLGEVWVVHRLDKETSGVLVLARTAEAHAKLSAQFETRDVEKVYHALVRGEPRWEERVIDAPLLPNGDRRHRTVIDTEEGKPSRTRLRVLRKFKGLALVEARPETGRTHQIRVHLASAGSPIACDGLYGDGKPLMLSQFKRSYRPTSGQDERPLLGRLGLHALRIEFVHPVTGERVSYEAPYAKDFAALLNQIAKL
jgi:RluA family pseudouridine synthase